MSSSPEGGPRPGAGGSIAAESDRRASSELRHGPRRERVLLRGESAASATPWQRVHRPAPEAGTRRTVVPVVPVPAAPAPAAAAPAAVAPEPVPAPPVVPPAARESLTWAEFPSDAPSYVGPERRSGEDRRLRSTARLSDVYAAQLDELREQARSEGWAAGHAEGIVAAAQVVAAAEQAAEARLAEAQVRWERRLATATAALGAAAAQLEATAAPVLDELRDRVLDAVVTLVGDLLGRELATADAAGLDALRRALTLCPTDAPVIVRLHPDDLAEVPAAELAALPASVTVTGDLAVERAGAVAEAGTTRIDAQLGPALERIRTVLRG